MRVETSAITKGSDKMIKSFKDLDIYRRGKELVKCVYKTTDKYPNQETNNVVSQLRRRV